MKSKAGYFSSWACISLVLLTILLVQSSCRSRKDFVYFSNDGGKTTISEYEQFIRQNDLLAIEVSSTEPELAIPFNPFTARSGNQPAGYINGIASPLGYLVDPSGEIEFPYLGKVKVAGKSREELCEYLRENLSPYLKNPLVYVRILNFKVTVLGDVGKPGTFNIPNEKITLPEVLGLAGDLNVTALRKNVLVIRTSDGNKKEYRIDLTSQDLFSSEVYFLQQGDVVYVESNKAQRNASAINSRISIVISLATLVITTLTLVLK